VRQSGVGACWQAPRLGLTANEVRERLRYGDWQRLHHGVYATFTSRPDREAQLWGALLRAGPVAVLSHHTAAERHGLLPRPSATIHVTVASRTNPARNEKIPGVVVHRSDVILSRCHPAMTPPCTRVEETVLDLIKVARTPDEAYDWICRALGQRRTTAERIRAALQARERFPLRTEIETALNDAGEGMLSWLERRYVRGVERSHGLPTASRQARVRHEGGNRYLDNLYEAYRLCVELDGAVAIPPRGAGPIIDATGPISPRPRRPPCASDSPISSIRRISARPPRKSPRCSAGAAPASVTRAARQPAR
jgi:hypothetical protein